MGSVRPIPSFTASLIALIAGLLLAGISGDAASLTGRVAVDVRFERLSALRRLAMVPAVRLAAVLLLGVLAAGLALVLGTFAERGEPAAAPGQVAVGTGLRRELVQGVGTVLIAVLALGVFLEGARTSLEVGWTPLILAIGGVLIAEWWKFGLCREHLTADITAWLPKVRTGGWLSGDDYNSEKWPEVVSTVKELLPAAQKWSSKQWRLSVE